jgi:hypothetical protein
VSFVVELPRSPLGDLGSDRIVIVRIYGMNNGALSVNATSENFCGS